MAWRSSPRAIWMWRMKSSIHTAGSVVPSYDSMFTGCGEFVIQDLISEAMRVCGASISGRIVMQL